MRPCVSFALLGPPLGQVAQDLRGMSADLRGSSRGWSPAVKNGALVTMTWSQTHTNRLQKTGRFFADLRGSSRVFAADPTWVGSDPTSRLLTTFIPASAIMRNFLQNHVELCNLRFDCLKSGLFHVFDTKTVSFARFPHVRCNNVLAKGYCIKHVRNHLQMYAKHTFHSCSLLFSPNSA